MSTTTGTSTTTSTSTTGEAPTSTGPADTGTFVSMPDLPPPVDCDPWEDTCPRGQKCKPYREDGAWKAVCADIDADPKGVGEACDKNVSTKFDDCPDGTMCFDFFDAVSEEGLLCTPLCEGTPDASSCADACTGCLRFQDRLFGVCPARCDLLAPDCPGEQVCKTLVFPPLSFCNPPGEALLGPGEVCLSPYQCQEGTACLPADMLPACDGASCCTPVCDQSQPDTCEAAVPGTVCAPWPVPDPDGCITPELGLCMAAP